MHKECTKMIMSLFSDDCKFNLLDQSEIMIESILFMGSSFNRELFIFVHSLYGGQVCYTLVTVKIFFFTVWIGLN